VFYVVKSEPVVFIVFKQSISCLPFVIVAVVVIVGFAALVNFFNKIINNWLHKCDHKMQ